MDKSEKRLNPASILSLQMDKMSFECVNCWFEYDDNIKGGIIGSCAVFLSALYLELVFVTASKIQIIALFLNTPSISSDVFKSHCLKITTE